MLLTDKSIAPTASQWEKVGNMNGAKKEETNMNEKNVLNKDVEDAQELTSKLSKVMRVLDSAAISSSIFNESELTVIAEGKGTYDQVRFENKKAVLRVDIRDYFTEAYSRSVKIGANAEWAQRQVVVRTMNSSLYKESFINDKDYAQSIGVSPAFISKAKTVVEMCDKFDLSAWKVTAVEELANVYRDCKKKELDFYLFLSVYELTEASTVKELREAVKLYKKYGFVKPEQTEEATSEEATSEETTSEEATSEEATSEEATSEEVDTKGAYKSMHIDIDFDGQHVVIDLTDENERKLSNAVLKLLSAKIRVAVNKAK